MSNRPYPTPDLNGALHAVRRGVRDFGFSVVALACPDNRFKQARAHLEVALLNAIQALALLDDFKPPLEGLAADVLRPGPGPPIAFEPPA